MCQEASKRMLISHKYKFIFVKTRKTASSSVEGLLEHLCAAEGHTMQHRQPYLESDEGVIAGRAGGQGKNDPLWAHSSASEIQKFLGKEKFESYSKVYCVRNPYEKVVSWFWHVMPSDTKINLEQDFASTKELFRNWLLMRPNLPIDQTFYRVAGRAFKAHRIHYETMSDDISDLSKMLGAEIDFAKIPNWKTDARRHK